MRSGPARRCASYCTWSCRSRTTVLESAEDQCRTPVIRGNFDNSCAEAGELAGSVDSEIASGVAFAAGVGFGGAIEGATGTFLATSESPSLAGICSVWRIALPSCAVFKFHQTPPANAAAMMTHTSSINLSGPRCAVSGDCEASLG